MRSVADGTDSKLSSHCAITASLHLTLDWGVLVHYKIQSAFQCRSTNYCGSRGSLEACRLVDSPQHCGHYQSHCFTARPVIFPCTCSISSALIRTIILNPRSEAMSSLPTHVHSTTRGFSASADASPHAHMNARSERENREESTEVKGI